MVAEAVRLKSKHITWTHAGDEAFFTLKGLVNACPKLYYIDYKLPIVLCTDASDYAIGAYLYQVERKDGVDKQQPIRFLSKSLTGAQLRWSTIEKEAYAIYYALTKLEDLLGGVSFTIKTDHNNLIFMNNAGSKKVLNWKLAIQHFDFFIEHIKGEQNIIADAFTRLVPRQAEVIVNTLFTFTMTPTQIGKVKECHEWCFAHWGVQKTLNLLQ